MNKQAAQEFQKDLIEQFEKAVARNGVPLRFVLTALELQNTNYKSWKLGKNVATLPSLMLLADYCGCDIDMVPRVRK